MKMINEENNPENLQWVKFLLSNLDETKNSFDNLIIEKMVRNKEKNYYDCVIEKKGEEHILKKFE